VNPYELGATLYMPATRDDLADIGNARKYPELRSIVYCTEDAVRERDLDDALASLERQLPALEHGVNRPLRFVRPRNPRVLERVLAMSGVFALQGAVLPKVTLADVDAWATLLRGVPLAVMVTLETPDVFDATHPERMRDALLASGLQLACVRVGGNDLLGALGLRRVRGVTAYDTALGGVIDRVVQAFRPHGVNVSAPVYDVIDDPRTLEREARLDLARGTFGKTIIHPVQAPIVHAAYRVDQLDLDCAEAILQDDAPAVFRLHGRMCEPSTHRGWAIGIVERARVYGTVHAPPAPEPSAF